MKIATVLNGYSPHHLDHLAPISFYLDCPLLVDDYDIYQLAKKYYPQITTHFTKINPLTAIFQYDLFIYTSVTPSLEMKAYAQGTKNAKLRIAYAPHGFSDKGDLSKRLMNHEAQDIGLIHGNEQLRQLKKYGIDKQLQAIITIGQPRKHFYEKHKIFYQTFIKPFEKKKKNLQTILYAPTFQDMHYTNSFDKIEALVSRYSESYQWIIKLHPLLESQQLIQVLRLKKRYQNTPNITILDAFMPLVWPFIEYCDLYLGDFSSIGFEFAQTEKPLYLFSTSANSLLAPFATLLHDHHDLQKPPKVYDFKNMSQDIFADVVPEEIKKTLLKII